MASSDIMSLLSMYSPEDLAALLTGPAPASASETDDSGLMFDCSLSQAVHAQPQASDNGHAGPAYSCWQDLAAEHQSNLLQVTKHIHSHRKQRSLLGKTYIVFLKLLCACLALLGRVAHVGHGQKLTVSSLAHGWYIGRMPGASYPSQEMAQSFAVTLEQQRKQQQLAHQVLWVNLFMSRFVSRSCSHVNGYFFELD